MPRPVLSTRFITAAAVLVAAGALWALARPLPEVERHRRQFAELQRQISLARETKAARSTDRSRVLRLRAQARTANGPQREAFDAEAASLESSLGWGSQSSVRSVVLATPLIGVRRTTSLAGFPPPTPDQGNGCTSCHVSMASPGYEQYPSPFRTHPSFANYVGASSPHPPSRVGCASCHVGDEYASTFEGAGHVRAADAARGRPVGARAWQMAGSSGAMLPVGRTEAGCVTCHLGERYQPGAPALSDALTTLERNGCYACHQFPGFEGTPKRGPDLRRIKSKLSPAWVRHWLADPTAIKPSTSMPRFWAGQEALSTPGRAGIEAVVAYLFANSDDVQAPSPAAPGNVARGRALAESVGCLGCHVIGDAPRDTLSLRRSFGQPLQAIGDKASQAWLVDWLRDPARYSPDTRMPNLRLSADEAVDIAAYLGTLSADAPTPATPPVDDDAYRDLLRKYDASTPARTLQLSGEPLRVEAGRTAIDALGCFNCHQIRGFEGRTTTVPIRPQPDWDDAAVAARFERSESVPQQDLSTGATRTGASLHPGPIYRFGPSERARLALALTAIAGPIRQNHGLTTPWHLAKAKGRTLVQERNCVGCHVIDGVGGDFVRLVSEPTLGPPLLTPEGARVQPAWLRGFLRQPSTIRPWLTVRMPTFGLSADDVDTVGTYFRGIAAEIPKPAELPPGVSAGAGKELFDLLKCQQCHVLGAVPKDQPSSNLAPDLRMAHERLQPDWILAWLRNPADILPGTRMPTFWPEYPKSFYPPLDGDGQKQIRAIRDHLLTLH